eukprot:gene18019-biopygen5289
MTSLFEPTRAGDLQLANRIAMAPLTRNRSPEAIPTDLVATYYAQRASAGLIISEATLAVAHKEMPGFGEQMRQISLKFVPTAILSRQVAVIRDQSLIINLPGQPKAIAETLEGLKDANGQQIVPGIFAAVPYCVDLIDGPYLETRDERQDALVKDLKGRHYWRINLARPAFFGRWMRLMAFEAKGVLIDDGEAFRIRGHWAKTGKAFESLVPKSGLK